MNDSARFWLLTSLAFVGVCALSLFWNRPEWEWVWQLRMPRLILACGIGIGLSIAGSALQALFSNPLCEPYTLGVSSGAAVGCVVAATLGWEASLLGLALPAFVGSVSLVTLLGILVGRYRLGTQGLLLVGVMLGFLGSSVVALWMAVAEPNGLQGVLFWLMGSLSRARFSGALMVLGGSLVALLWMSRQARELDALLLGEETARSLGVDVDRLRRRLIWVVAMIVALCVSAGGVIGFVGLLVPHLVRQWKGSLHGSGLPASALLGAALMVFADTCAQQLISPYELPVGVVTALIGAPVFIFILFRKGGRAWS